MLRLIGAEADAINTAVPADSGDPALGPLRLTPGQEVVLEVAADSEKGENLHYRLVLFP